MRALFIQHDHVSPIGPIGAAFRSLGYEVEQLPVRSGDGSVVTFPDASGYDAVVPMGAPWSVYDPAINSWLQPELSFLRSAQDAGVPVLGLCFGAQALATALGGSVVRASRAEVGWTDVHTDAPDLVPSGPWFQWHGGRWNLPPGGVAIARTGVCDQAFVVGRRSLGVQFHPEMTPEMLDGWVGNGGAQYLQELGIDVTELRIQTVRRASAAAERAHALVAAFHSGVDSVGPRPAACP